MLRVAIVLALSGIISIVAVAEAAACMNTIHRDRATGAAKATVFEFVQDQRDVRMRARNGVWKEDEAVIAKASDDLNDGKNAEVIVAMYDHFGLDINSWALNPKHVSEREHEVVLLVALAVLRTEGEVERHHKHVKSKPRRKVDNVRWAIRAMEGLAYMQFAPERHIAEAWGRDPELQELATKKLLQLEKDDKLLSPFQFDLLARLLRARGEAETAEKIELAKLNLKD